MDKKTFLALPEKQRKAHQERLQAQGLYTGDIDGHYGTGTQAAFAAEAKKSQEEAATLRASEEKARQDKLRADELEIERIKANTQKTTGDTAAAEATAKAARTEEYNRQASSAPGLASQFGSWVAAPAAAGALGYYAGGKLNDRLNAGQEKRNETLRGAAADRVRGLTTRDGAVKGVTLAGAMPPSNATMRVASRMGPHAGLGALSIGKGAQLILGGEEDQPFYSRMGDVAAGTGYVGFGSGLLKRGIEQAASPGVSPDAQALSVINSNQLRRNGAPGGSKLADALAKGQIIDAEVIPEGQKALPRPDAPEPKPLNPGTAAYMRQQLRDFGVKGTSKMTKSALAEKLAEQMAEHGSKRTVGKKITKGAGKAAIPLAVGSYMAAAGDSEAADGSLGDRATNAAGNFAAGAGAAYGGSKLVDALSKIAPGVMQGLSAGATMATPFAAADAYDPTQEQLNMDRNIGARILPEFLQFGAIGDAREMAQTPTPNPERRSMGPRIEDPRLQNRIRRMTTSGASPEQIAHFLNGL
jgi:hypothetical protein